MKKYPKKTSNAVEILNRRYIGDNPERKLAIEAERVNAEVASTIYELRKGADLTQKELANLVGTTQSVISRLEDADYEGHSLSMLKRIAQALNKRLKVNIKTIEPETEIIRFAFQEVMRKLRQRHRLNIDQLAEKLGIDRNELIAIERDSCHRPAPIILYKLSNFYGVSQKKLSELAGFLKAQDEVRNHASKFAAQSDSFALLNPEERRQLDEFVKFLREET